MDTRWLDKTCSACGTPNIATRRSCCCCGMRPGSLHNNGLCASCQHPEAGRR